MKYPYPTRVRMASRRLSLFDFFVRSSNKAYGTSRGLRRFFKSFEYNAKEMILHNFMEKDKGFHFPVLTIILNRFVNALQGNGQIQCHIK